MPRKSGYNLMVHVLIQAKEDYNECHKSFDHPPLFPCAMLDSAKNLTSTLNGGKGRDTRKSNNILSLIIEGILRQE